MKLIKDPFTGSFEIVDAHGKRRGVLLRFQKRWAVFLDGRREQMRDTYREAVDLCLKLLGETSDSRTMELTGTLSLSPGNCDGMYQIQLGDTFLHKVIAAPAELADFLKRSEGKQCTLWVATVPDFEPGKVSAYVASAAEVDGHTLISDRAKSILKLLVELKHGERKAISAAYQRTLKARAQTSVEEAKLFYKFLKEEVTMRFGERLGSSIFGIHPKGESK